MSQEHIPITDESPEAQAVHVGVAELLNAPVREPHSQEFLKSRRDAETKKHGPIRKIATVVGASALIAAGGLYAGKKSAEYIGDKLDNQAKVQLEQTQDIRDAVQENIQRNELLEAEAEAKNRSDLNP